MLLVRDDWEENQPGLEAQLSSLMGVPWTTDYDIGHIYNTYATESYAKTQPGKMFKA